MAAPRVAFSCLVAAALLVAPAAAAEPAATTETTEISLEQLKAPGAMTLLRTIVGTRGLKLVDDHTIGVTDSPEVALLAKAVVDLAEQPSDIAGEVATHPAPDGSVIAAIRVQHAPMADVAQALRTEVAVARSVFDDELSTVVVRDTPEKVQAAIDAIRRLEQRQH